MQLDSVIGFGNVIGIKRHFSPTFTDVRRVLPTHKVAYQCGSHKTKSIIKIQEPASLRGEMNGVQSSKSGLRNTKKAEVPTRNKGKLERELLQSSDDKNNLREMIV